MKQYNVTAIKYFKVTMHVDELAVVGYSATQDIYKEGDTFITVLTDPNGIETYSIRVDLIQSFAVTPVADEI